VYILPEYLLTY